MIMNDFVIVLWKSDDALLKYEVLDNNVFLSGIDYCKFKTKWMIMNTID